MQRFFLVLAVLVAAAIAKDLKCPSVPGKFPFDEQKFAGQWYAIAGAFPQHFTKQHGEKKCLKMTVSVMGSGDDTYRSTRMTYMMDDKPMGKEILTQPCKTDKSSTSYAVYKKDGEDKWSQPMKQVVMATDYDNYALMFMCQPKFNETTKTFERMFVASIMSRTPTLKLEYTDVLKNMITGFDFKPEEFKYMQHTDC